MASTMFEETFYVWNDAKFDFDQVNESDVICPECGAKPDRMTRQVIDPCRGEIMLECLCGEQFFTHDD